MSDNNKSEGAVTIAADEHDDRVAVLRIERPPVNALSQSMWDQLASAAVELRANTQYRAVVIAGGRHFAAGADIVEMLELTTTEFDARNRVLQGAFQLLATAPQVLVAAVNGYALGGGCELALAADFRVASRRAVLGLPEIKLGIMPGSGGTQRLAHIIGLTRAKRMVLTGAHVSADEALSIGLVDEVVDDPYARAIEMARQFAAGPAALAHAKRAVEASVRMPLEAGLALEAASITACFASDDGQAGMRAFAEQGSGATVTFKGH